jgi:hypothetical protein
MRNVIKNSVMFGLVLSVMASASTIDIKQNGYGAYGTVRFTYNGTTEYVYAGLYTHDKLAGTGEGNYWADGRRTVPSFCMDILQNSPTSSVRYDMIPVQNGPNDAFGAMGNQKADYLRNLWYQHFDSSWVGNGPFTAAQNDGAKTFEACVWKIIFDDFPSDPTKYDIASGKFAVDSSTLSVGLANSWLRTLNGAGPKADLRCLSSSTNQDYLVMVSNLVTVPEPATILLLLSAGGMVVWRKRGLK